MYQLPVNNLTRIRKARKQVKKSLEDIGLEFCKEAAEEFKEFCPDEELVKDTLCSDICTWDPSYSKTQKYRSKPFCCTECSFSSRYYSGYKNHFRNVHRKLFDKKMLLNCPYCTFTANKRTLETHVKIFHIPNSARRNYGGPQGPILGKKTNLERVRQEYGMEKAMYFCKKCTFRDSLYNVVRRHIYREHFQHIVSPYLGMVAKSAVNNGVLSVNGNNIFCKQCQFSTRSYEALVQHVIEYHERIGSQVTTMIGHANMLVMSQKAPLSISRGRILGPDPTAHPVIGYLKPVAPSVKNQPFIPTNQTRVIAPSNTVAENSATGVNTAQTQKWKICTVCNELFPENLYSAHFESAHKAKKVWALAKYIMKIHNFTSKCLLCNRYLPSDTLLNHMLIHGLTCPQCHSAFHSVEKIMEHVAQAHPDEFVGPPGAAPLTFDLTIKQGKSSNVQLAVLTFNMKEPINGQDQSAPVQKHVPPPGKLPPPKMIDKQSEPRGFVSLINNSDVGKTVCPLCFSILKGPISDALSIHLRERHQVLRTMHPVEKKMTYKCIHCLGVYTSNMVASTITLHLVQCRAVGRNQASQGLKSPLTLDSSGASILKRQLLTQATSNPKKIRLDKDSKLSANSCGKKAECDNLALDPRSYEHKTYEARKNFLTAYFNRRPYPTPLEEEKLSASLWLWKSDIAGHFASKRKMCLKGCETNKVSVLLGFDMYALKKVKHNLIFSKGKLVGTSSRRATGFKSATPNTKQNKQCGTPNHISKLSTCTETISIDSDTDPETGGAPAEKEIVDTNHEKNVESKEWINLTEETKSVDLDDTSQEKGSSFQDEKGSSLQDEKETSLQDEKETSLQDETETSLQDETATSLQDEKETSLQDEKETSLQDEKETSLQDEKETSLQDEKETSLQDEKETSLQDEKETSLQDEKETSLQDEKETSLQDEKETSLQDETETSLQDETETSLQDEKETSLQDEKTTSLQDEKETSLQDETETSPQDEKTTFPQDEKETSLQDETETSLQDEKETPLQDEKETSLQDEKETSLQDETETSPQDEKTTFPQDEKETSLQDEKETSLQDEKETSLQDETATSLQDETATSLQDETATSLQDEKETSLQDEKETSLQDEKTTFPQDEKETSLQDEKETSLQDEKETSLQDEKETSPQDETETSLQDETETSPQDEKTTSPQDEKTTFPQDEKETSLQDEKETSLQDETDTSPQDEKTTSLQDEKETSLQDEKETSLQDETATSLQDETATSLQDETATSLQDETATSLQDETATSLQDEKETSLQDEKETSLQDETATSLQDETATSLQDETATSLQDETATSLQDETATSLQDETATSLQDETATSLQDETETSLQDEKETSLQDEKETSLQDETETSLQDGTEKACLT
ncbi:activity-dependent neuroprotective protein a [Leuresthes tenuis]|uniref:activity-dependent neuroprotective protein a n=1 Tax=Leuresthes tenuis TaxID=355514 RepID=UPI003B5058AA